MKVSFRKFFTAAAAVVLTLGMTMPACACTGVYIGSEASVDGTILLARSNDHSGVAGNYLIVVDSVENEPGRTMPVDNGDSIFAPIPSHTYHYTATPFMKSGASVLRAERDAAACTNECGVAITMSITAFARPEALAADQEPDDGLTEATADELVICQSSTAREAVEVLCGLIDTYGSSESNIAMIADQDEAWYVEMYTGHQYAAVKLPADKAAVFGNEFSLEYLSDYEESIASPKLESLAADNGFAVYGDNGELNLRKTYSVDFFEYSHMRTWIGHEVLAPGSCGDYSTEAVYPLTFTPAEKVSLQDVMELMRNRYEGTGYSPDETGRTDMRVIGTDAAMSVHVLQVYPDLPAEMACVTWESSGPAIYGVFVPLSNICTKPSASYGLDQSADEIGKFDYLNYPYYAFKGLNTLCMADYRVYGIPVRSYWKTAETNMIDAMARLLKQSAKADHSTAEALITAYCTQVQEQAFSDAKSLFNDVLWYQSRNSNTIKYDIDPETFKSHDSPRVIEPMTVTLDASSYANIPGSTAGRKLYIGEPGLYRCFTDRTLGFNRFR